MGLKDQIAAKLKTMDEKAEVEIDRMRREADAHRLALERDASETLQNLLSDNCILQIIDLHARPDQHRVAFVVLNETKATVYRDQSSAHPSSRGKGRDLEVGIKGGDMSLRKMFNTAEVLARVQELTAEGVQVSEQRYDAHSASFTLKVDYTKAK